MIAEMVMKFSPWATTGNEGKLNTPWDKAYRQSLVRRPPNPVEGLYTLERGVNYFVLKLEKMGLKTFWSCEGHPSGFYVVFQAPHKTARNIALISRDLSVDVTIANITHYIRERKAKGCIPNCWNLHFLPHGNCYEMRNYLLRELAKQWEKKL